MPWWADRSICTPVRLRDSARPNVLKRLNPNIYQVHDTDYTAVVMAWWQAVQILGIHTKSSSIIEFHKRRGFHGIWRCFPPGASTKTSKPQKMQIACDFDNSCEPATAITHQIPIYNLIYSFFMWSYVYIICVMHRVVGIVQTTECRIQCTWGIGTLGTFVLVVFFSLVSSSLPGTTVFDNRCGEPYWIRRALKHALIALSRRRLALDAVWCLTCLASVPSVRLRFACAREGAFFYVLYTRMMPLSLNSLKRSSGPPRCNCIPGR